MPKYLNTGSYSMEGVSELLKDGESSRKAQEKSTVEALVGKPEAFYFAFGGNHFYCIVKFPDSLSAAGSLAVNAGNGFKGNNNVPVGREDKDQTVREPVKRTVPGK
jgi:hypothetical protein